MTARSTRAMQQIDNASCLGCNALRTEIMEFHSPCSVVPTVGVRETPTVAWLRNLVGTLHQNPTNPKAFYGVGSTPASAGWRRYQRRQVFGARQTALKLHSQLLGGASASAVLSCEEYRFSDRIPPLAQSDPLAGREDVEFRVVNPSLFDPFAAMASRVLRVLVIWTRSRLYRKGARLFGIACG